MQGFCFSLSLSQDCERRRVKTRHRIVLLLHLMDVIYKMMVKGANKMCTKRYVQLYNFNYTIYSLDSIYIQ